MQNIRNIAILNGALPAEFAPTIGSDPRSQIIPPGFAVAQIAINEGRISAVAPPSARSLSPHPTPRLDASGCIVLPGFIDIHVHGSAGYDVMDASPAALTALTHFFAQHGVTAFMPTTMTAPHSQTRQAVAAITTALAHLPDDAGARMLGVHLEGPYISPQFPGAQPATYIRPPNLAEFSELLATGPIRMITVAPEEPGADRLIAHALQHQVKVVLGHTNATYEACEAAIAAGVSQATHTYNAMSGLHQRHPGTLGAVLSNDAIYAQLISDNFHVHPAAMKILARCKGVTRTILITDAMRATGLADGEYDLGGQVVLVKNGQCRLPDGTLAGSTLTMERGLSNFMAASGLSLAEVWPVSSRTAAQALGLDQEVGAITPGYRADLVVLDAKLAVVATLVGGNLVYLREPERLTQQPL